MKKLTLFFFTLITSLSTFSQCTEKELFPIKLGQSKVSVLKNLQLNPKFNLGRGEENVQTDLWQKFDYLKPDSVYRSQLVFTTSTNQCFNNSYAKLVLEFADNILYEITYELDFDRNDFKSVNDIYINISQLLEPLYDNNQEDEHTSWKGDIEPNESTGMFFKFYDTYATDRNLDFTQISYNFDKKYVYNKYSYKLEDTGEIEKISLTLKSINTNLVKIDGRGY